MELDGCDVLVTAKKKEDEEEKKLKRRKKNEKNGKFSDGASWWIVAGLTNKWKVERLSRAKQVNNLALAARLQLPSSIISFHSMLIWYYIYILSN